MINTNPKSNYLGSLISAGADAVKNLYYISFSDGLFTSESDENRLLDPQHFTVRTSTFTPPTPTTSTSDKTFLTVKIAMPTPSIEYTKEFTFHLRVDENYSVYQQLLRQQSYHFNGSMGYASSDINDNGLFTTKVYVPKHSITQIGDYDSSKFFEESKLMYTFYNCWISKITMPNYSYDGATPIDIDVTVKFSHMEDPQFYAIEEEIGDNE